MADEIRMLTALGVRNIAIFDLNGTVKRFGAAGVRAIIEGRRHPMSQSELNLATLPTPQSLGVQHFFNGFDEAAVVMTLEVTTERGRTQLPNAYPDGCGDLRAHPLRRSR